jgi:hypothetical protein
MSLFKLSLGGLGLLALSACFVACGDDDKDEGTPEAGDSGGGSSSGGKTGSGGDTEAGAGGSGGSGGSGGATEAGAGGSTTEGGPGPTDGGGAGGGDGAVGDGAVGDGGGMAMAKFCNEVALTVGQQQQSVTFRLVIGEGASAVTLEAATGACSPAVNLPCAMFASGTDIAVDMFDKTDLTQPLHGILIDSADGESWIFRAEIDTTGASPRPVVVPYDPPQNETCSSTDYADLPLLLSASANSSSKDGYSRAR